MQFFIGWFALYLLYLLFYEYILMMFEKGVSKERRKLIITHKMWYNSFRYFIPFFWGKINLMTIACEMWRFMIFYIIYVFVLKESSDGSWAEFLQEVPSFKGFAISMVICALTMPAVVLRSENGKIP